ncbi:hypothetical protein V7S43_008538 [Phytophthora oleae]|uniref:EF-hand domain-containing protein n=1 Tax=Phytophthora oleae TaxID=2107226 RepID=A0ABD3FH73_9STRA
MDIVQASFQASFDSRVERLGDVDLDDLRVIFRYFDTDGDGAVSADQACRLFALLGLDVNTVQVRELGEVYLNEFIKIVDSHINVPLPAASEAPEALETLTQVPVVEEELTQQIPEPNAGETDRKLRNEKILEDEWKLLDTYRRGRVSMQELRIFLASCRSTLSLEDTERFLETYGNVVENDGVEELEFTKEGFLKFRHEYTPKKMALSDDDLSSDDDESELLNAAATLGLRAPDSNAESQVANGAGPVRVQSRHTERGPSDNPSDHTLSSLEHEFVVNPEELVESDESDEETVARHINAHSITDDGHDSRS